MSATLRPCDYAGHVPDPITYQAERTCRVCRTRQLVTVSYAPNDPWRISYRCLSCRGRWTIDGTP